MFNKKEYQKLHYLKNKHRKKPTPRLPIICEFCGKSHTTTRHYLNIGKGKFCSKKCSKMNENNPAWVGDKVGYAGIHNWIRRRLPKPKKCQCCNTNPPYDIANISQKYLRQLNDWEWLCRSCHMRKDGRTEMLTFYSRVGNLKKKRDDKGRYCDGSNAIDEAEYKYGDR